MPNNPLCHFPPRSPWNKISPHHQCLLQHLQPRKCHRCLHQNPLSGIFLRNSSHGCYTWLALRTLEPKCFSATHCIFRENVIVSDERIFWKMKVETWQSSLFPIKDGESWTSTPRLPQCGRLFLHLALWVVALGSRKQTNSIFFSSDI